LRDLARTCVFAKQSLGPIHCDRVQQRARSSPPHTAPLLPKLRGQYAEFLDHVSLVHLRLLASPTCVGLRYGRSRDSLPGFSRPPTPQSLRLGLPPPSRRPVSGLFAQTLRRYTVVHMTATASFRGPPEVHHHKGGAGISTGCPSSTPLGPRLRVRLTPR
jgi:hypothetical protein